MLKYETFSNFYREKKLEEKTDKNSSHEIRGTLAISPKHIEKAMPIGRRTNRIWWENGWKLNK